MLILFAVYAKIMFFSLIEVNVVKKVSGKSDIFFVNKHKPRQWAFCQYKKRLMGQP
jgi:hypothetical protein